MRPNVNLPSFTVKNRVRNYEKKIKNTMNKDKPVLVRKKKNPEKKVPQKPEKKESKKQKKKIPEKKVPQKPEKKESKKQKKKIPKKKRQPDTTKLLMKLAKDLDIKINKTNVEMKNLQRMIRKRLKSLYKM